MRRSTIMEAAVQALRRDADHQADLDTIFERVRARRGRCRRSSVQWLLAREARRRGGAVRRAAPGVYRLRAA